MAAQRLRPRRGGGVGYEGRTNFTGTVPSLGGAYAQLDLGFRPHWWFPAYDSSMLMSTETPTLPSATLSNYEPFSPLGIKYRFFVDWMSQGPVNFQQPNGSFIAKIGTPHLFGAHVSIEPACGWVPRPQPLAGKWTRVATLSARISLGWRLAYARSMR